MSGMKSDHYYAEMLNMMREQGRKDNPTTLQLGIMQSATSVKIDDLLLEAEDLYIADYLMAEHSRKMKTSYNSSGGYTQGELVYTEGLKKGDLVAVQKLSNNDMYVILARVVQV